MTSQPSSQEAPEEDFGEPSGPTGTILLIEDSMPQRRMLRKILEREGHTIIEAQDGRAGLASLQKSTPAALSCVLCDLLMPIMDGATFIKKAQEEYGEKLPPIIVCSSLSNKEAIKAVHQLGVAGYILKPFMTQTIVNKVREVMEAAS